MPSLDARGLRRAVELVLVGTPVHEHRRLTTAKHIAERLGFSERYVRGLIHAGAFEIVRFGRAVRVYEDSVDRWIESERRRHEAFYATTAGWVPGRRSIVPDSESSSTGDAMKRSSQRQRQSEGGTDG